jgi:cell division topological specificity factor
MGLGTFLGRLFGRNEAAASKSAAKDRLRLVLMHDRTDIPATMMEAIRTEMMTVLSKYVEIDNDAMDFQLEREAGAIGLVLNIPIRRVKSESEASEALAVMHAIQSGEAISGDVSAPPVDPSALVESPESEHAPRPAADKPAKRQGADAVDEGPAADTADLAKKEEINEAPSVSAEIAVKAAPLRLPGARVTASVSARALGYAKASGDAGLLGSNAAAETAPPQEEADQADSEAEETRPMVRDAWYSAELLHVTSSERQEPSD